MGLIYSYCISSKHKDDPSYPYDPNFLKVWEIFAAILAEFVGGLLTAMVVLTLAILFVGIPPDGTFTVVGTNDRWTVVLMTFAFAFCSHIVTRGAFGYAVPFVFGNSWNSMLSIFMAWIDDRLRHKRWWKIFVPFVLIAGNAAGAIAGVAWFKAVFGTSAISSYFIPSLANTAVSGSYLWAYINSALVYTLLLHIVGLTCNSTSDFFGSMTVVAMAEFLFGIVLFMTVKQFPSFAFNWAFCYLTGTYEILWIDVAGGFTGVIITGVLYWLVWHPLYLPFGLQDNGKYLHIPYTKSKKPKDEEHYPLERHHKKNKSG